MSAESFKKLKVQCLQDPGRGCWILGSLLEPVDREHAIKAHKLSCSASYEIACMDLLKISGWDFEDSAILENRQAMDVITKACNPETPAITASACEKLADIWRLQNNPDAALLYRDLIRVSHDGHGRWGFAQYAEKAGYQELACLLKIDVCQDGIKIACSPAEECKPIVKDTIAKLDSTQSWSAGAGRVFESYMKLGKALRNKGELQDAQDIYEMLCALDRGLLGADFYTKSSCKNAESLKAAREEFSTNLPTLQAACKDSDEEQCMKLANLYLDLGNMKEAEPLLASLCDLKELSTKSSKAESSCSESEIEVSDKELVNKFHRALCNANKVPTISYESQRACSKYQQLLKESNKVSKFREVSEVLCRLKMEGPCNVFVRYEYNQGDAEKAFTLAEQKCDGLKSAFCRLRDIWLAKKGSDIAKDYYKKRCEEKNARSCLYYGIALSVEGKENDGTKIFTRARPLFKSSCEASKDEEQCLGEPLLSCIEGNTRAGESRLKALCVSGNKKACRITKQNGCSSMLKHLKEEYKTLNRWNT